MRSLAAAGSMPQLCGLVGNMQQPVGAAMRQGGLLADLLQRCSVTLLQGGIMSTATSPQRATPHHDGSSSARGMHSAMPKAGLMRQGLPQPAASADSSYKGLPCDASRDGPQPGSSASSAPLLEHRRQRGRRVVAVAISGGVDSAVAASMMQQQGHEVLGVFMRNWDEAEEQGNQNCSVERDFQDAQAVCRHLGMPLLEVEFVAQYWQRVFQPFLEQYVKGLTPNPDLTCNRAIKFDALLQHARSLGADTLATGHYARLRTPPGGDTQLLRGVDPLKDQSYFLAAVPSAALGRCEFPLGGLRKEDVRRAAAAARVPTAAKRSSAGICFIGRRSFGDFLAQYVDPVPGRFVDVGSGADHGPCSNMLAVTHGQRTGIGGAMHRLYVVGKDMAEHVVQVAEGTDHAALFAESALLAAPHWVAGAPPPLLEEGSPIELAFKARYGQPLRSCTVQAAAAAAAPFEATRHSSYPGVADAGVVAGGAESRAGDASGRCCGDGGRDVSGDGGGQLVVRFQRPVRAVTPGQELVLYNGEVCLGAAPVLAGGPSLAEQGRRLPVGLTADDSLHMAALAAAQAQAPAATAAAQA